MTCCDRLHPCSEAVALWEAVGDAHQVAHRATVAIRATKDGARYLWRDYDAALTAYEAHFVETPVEQGVML